MTTIAFKDGWLAADGRACSGTLIISEKAIKLFKLKDRSWVGGCGDVPLIRAYREWLDRGAKGNPPALVDPTDKDSWGRLLRVFPSRKTEVLVYDHIGCQAIFDNMYAMGSGREFALAAMDLGKSAEQAVRYAMTRDTGTGGEVIAIKVF